MEHIYQLKDKSNGVYVFVIEGGAFVDSQNLQKRDALGVWETESIQIKTEKKSKILLIEVPMKF